MTRPTLNPAHRDPTSRRSEPAQHIDATFNSVVALLPNVQAMTPSTGSGSAIVVRAHLVAVPEISTSPPGNCGSLRRRRTA